MDKDVYHDLIQRAILMIEASVPPAVLHDTASNNPVVAWLAEAREAIDDDGCPHPAEQVAGDAEYL